MISDFRSRISNRRTEISGSENSGKKKIQERESFFKYAKTILTVYHNLLAEASWDITDKHFAEAIQELEYVEYRLDCLKEHPEEFYKDKQAVKKIGSIRNRIISWYG